MMILKTFSSVGSPENDLSFDSQSSARAGVRTWNGWMGSDKTTSVLRWSPSLVAWCCRSYSIQQLHSDSFSFCPGPPKWYILKSQNFFSVFQKKLQLLQLLPFAGVLNTPRQKRENSLNCWTPAASSHWIFRRVEFLKASSSFAEPFRQQDRS